MCVIADVIARDACMVVSKVSKERYMAKVVTSVMNVLCRILFILKDKL
jgi:hypothetical protein